MQELLRKAGLTPGILKDASKRAAAIDEYNAGAGGLRSLMREGKLRPASTHPIVPASREQTDHYYIFAAEGKRVPVVFAAGRATRMKLPGWFDKLGIGGLNPKILAELDTLREGEEAPPAKIESSVRLKSFVDEASNGRRPDLSMLSFVQRQLLQWRCQMGQLTRDPKFLKLWLSNASFAVVANEENKSSLALQLGAIRFAGLAPEHVYIIVQPEEGGLEVREDGSVKPYSEQTWPEGHGKPFLDMRSDANAAYRLNARGHLVPLKRAFYEELSERRVERLVFAQVNDLHLLEDMAHVERWSAAEPLMAGGAEMAMEMVDNGLRQKGGGIFEAPDGNTVMRDTIAMKARDLEAYAVPQSLSRMFYELSLAGLAKLDASALPAYISERKTSDGRVVLTREFYSGDASGRLRATAIQQKGYALHTFKVQSRIPEALEALRKQDSQPGFQSLQIF